MLNDKFRKTNMVSVSFGIIVVVVFKILFFEGLVGGNKMVGLDARNRFVGSSWKVTKMKRVRGFGSEERNVSAKFLENRGLTVGSLSSCVNSQGINRTKPRTMSNSSSLDFSAKDQRM